MDVVIADDDALVADLLAHHVAKADPSARVRHAAEGHAAAALLRGSPPDLLLLDLDMPGISGRELIGMVDPRTAVVIVTGDPAFAAEAFGHEVVDYLVKPVSFDRFAKAWRRVAMRNAGRPSQDQDHVFVRAGQDIVRIELGQVQYIKSESNYVRFVLKDPAGVREVTSLMNLKDLEQKLPAHFVRVHRSYIVNLRHVEKLDHQDIKIGRELVPVSEGHRAELLRRLSML